MSTLKYIFFISLIILVSLFAAKNMHTVEVHFYDGSSADSTIKVPTMVLVSCAFGFGFLLAWFFELFAHFKLKVELREKQKNIERLEKELSRSNQSADASVEPDNPTSLSKN
ncbi:LapA family protein [Nitrospinaceae bacterium]|nr:LapA family protein [Nitrospinaceae bacterium]